MAEIEGKDARRVVEMPSPQMPDLTSLMMAPMDVLEDWLFILSAENNSRIAKTNHHAGAFLDQRSTEYLFTVCEKLYLPPEVKYVGAALFDQFMLEHVTYLYGNVKEDKESDPEAKQKQWNKVQNKLANQLNLRILSCLQIASKLQGKQRYTLMVRDVMEFLRRYGRSYDAESVVHSEIRVMKSLDFRLQVASPLEYVETFLKLLYLTDDQLPVNDYWKWSVLVLDLVFMRRSHIYARLVSKAAAVSSVTRESLVRVESDYMLLSAGVVAMAAGVAEGFQKADTIGRMLERIGRVPSTDTSDFCVSVVQDILFLFTNLSNHQ